MNAGHVCTSACTFRNAKNLYICVASHSRRDYFQNFRGMNVCAADSGVIYDTVGEYIFKSSDVCVCAAHSGRVNHTLVQTFMGMCVCCTQWTGLSHSGRIYFRQPLCVCIAHNGRVYHTVGMHVFKNSWACVCAAHTGRVYHTMGGHIFNSCHVCELHTMGGFITQWAGIFAKYHGHVCMLHTSDGTSYKNTYVCVCCTQ